MKNQSLHTGSYRRSAGRLLWVLALPLGVAFLAIGGQSPSRPRRAEQQQDEKPIRLSSDLVTVLTSVSDTVGNHVDNLNIDDFQLFEDGKRQEISGLYRENQMPLRLVFLFETSLSIRHRFDFEQRAAARFFREVMQPGDQAAIISVSTDPRMEIQFTPDVNRLVDTLAHLNPGGSTSLYNSMIEAAHYLHPSEGRHVIVLLSDGDDTSSSSTLEEALTAVQRSDAVIYAVHSTGIPESANERDLGGEVTLKGMCKDTGGEAFFPPIYKDQQKEARDLDNIYRQLAADVRAQYVLTYYSKNETRDGRFRTVRVEAKRPGLQVRSRTGYYAPSGH
ncbi:MAG TPA: VWA domain-containing protein [Blastocatellia bacterium]|nr:VWA domain-containing protein [Blastocatellia bacterium]